MLPNEYVIHVPPTESLSRRKWSEGSHGKKNRLFINFMAKVMDGATSRVPLCLQACVEMAQAEYAGARNFFMRSITVRRRVTSSSAAAR